MLDNPTFKKIALLAAVVVTGVAGITYYFIKGEVWTFAFTQAQIEEQLAKTFPARKTHLLLFTVHYENPRVQLTDGSSHVQIGLDARLNISVDNTQLGGSADVTTKVAYDAETGTFVLHDAHLDKLSINGASERFNKLAKDASNEFADEQVSGIAIYKLRPTDVKHALARLVLKSVSVRSGVLYIEVGV